MTCQEYRELMPALALGECPTEQRRKLEAHLATCPACDAEFRRLKEICRILEEDAYADELSEIDSLRIESTLYRRLAAEAPTRRRWPNRTFGLISAIAAGLALFVLGYGARSFVTSPRVPSTKVTAQSASSTLAQYEGGLSQGGRFSAVGLKTIALGWEGVVKKSEGQ
jgi:anti-sigma factor RsiW